MCMSGVSNQVGAGHVKSVQGVHWVAVLIKKQHIEGPKPVEGEHSKGYTWRGDQQPVLCPDWDQRVDLRVDLSGGSTGGPWYKGEIVCVRHCM